MVENNSATAFTSPLLRRGTLGIGNVTHKRSKPLFDDSFEERSKVVT